MTKILFLFCGDATNRSTIVRKPLSAVETHFIRPTRQRDRLAAIAVSATK
jgi:hypothetical protein